LSASSPSIRHTTRNQHGGHTLMQWPRTSRIDNAQAVRCADTMRRARTWRLEGAYGSSPHFSGRSHAVRMGLQSDLPTAGAMSSWSRKSAPTTASTSLLAVVLACVLRACRTLPRVGRRPPEAMEAAQRIAGEHLWRPTHIPVVVDGRDPDGESARDGPTVVSGSALGP